MSPPLMFDPPFDQLACPVLAVVGVAAETYLRADELHDWATDRAKVCRHERDFSLSCRQCQGTMMAVNLIDGGAPGVRLVPLKGGA
jgi:alkyl hydroperoxide reductase subunit AhpF